MTGTTDLEDERPADDAWGLALFLIVALALVGVPPLSGFFGKLTLLQAGIEAGPS